MNLRPNESSPDRLDPPPEQKQLRNITNLISTLSSDGINETGSYKRSDYPIGNLELDNDIVGLRVLKLTEEGRLKDLETPLAIAVISRSNQSEKKQTEYVITEDGTELKISRHEKIIRPEDEQVFSEDEIKKLRNMPLEESERIFTEALEGIFKDLEKTSQEKEFERTIGESYVGGQEAKRVEEILTKLAEQYNLLH